MDDNMFTAPDDDRAERVVDLIKVDAHGASELMKALSNEEQVALVARQAYKDPKAAQELLFLLKDDESKKIVDNLEDRTVFRMMKAQSSTHIGMLSLLKPERVQSILDLDQELFMAQGDTDPQAAYHWIVSFLEEDEAGFAKLLKNVDIKVVASAFQEKVIKPANAPTEITEEDDSAAFPADFLVKLDRGELKPEDLEVADEETLDVLTKIYLTDEHYFNELVSIMLRDETLKSRAAEEAMDRVHANVGDLTEVTQEAEDMFEPLEEQ